MRHMSRITLSLPFGPELNSGWCQYASVQAVGLDASVARIHAAWAESAAAGMLLFSERTSHAPAR